MKLPVTKEQLDAVIRATQATTDLAQKAQLIALADVVQMAIQLNEREEQALALTRDLASKEITSVHTGLMDRLLAMGIIANVNLQLFNQDEVMRAIEGMQILLEEVRLAEDEELREDIMDRLVDGTIESTTITWSPTICGAECSDCNLPDDDDCAACENPSDPCCRAGSVESELTDEDRDILDSMRDHMKLFVKSTPPALFSLVHLNHKLDAFIEGAINRDAFTGDDIALISAMFNDVLTHVVETEPSPEDRFEMRADVQRIRTKIGALLGTEI